MNYSPRDTLEPEAFDVEQAQRVSGIGRTALYEAMADGRLRARKFGRKTIIMRADLRAFLDALPAFQSEAARVRAA